MEQINTGDRILKFSTEVIKYLHKLELNLASIKIQYELTRALFHCSANYQEIKGTFSSEKTFYRLNEAKAQMEIVKYWLARLMESDFGDAKLNADFLNESIEIDDLLMQELQVLKS